MNAAYLLLQPTEKQKKIVSRQATKVSEPLQGGPVSQEDLRAALRIVRGEQLPPTNDGKEQYFMQHVSIGEQLATQGTRFKRHVLSCLVR